MQTNKASDWKLMAVTTGAAFALIGLCSGLASIKAWPFQVTYWKRVLEHELEAARRQPYGHWGEHGGGDPRARQEAARALGALGQAAAPAVPVLIRTLKSIRPEIYYGMSRIIECDESTIAAREALVAIGPPAIPALREALDDADTLTRVHATRALWELGVLTPDEALPILWAAWADLRAVRQDRVVRFEADEAIRQIGCEPRKEIRLNVARQLGSYCQPKRFVLVGSDTLTELAKLAGDPDAEVRGEAEQALKRSQKLRPDR